MAAILVSAAAGYLAAGLAVGVAFLLLGVERFDPRARGALAFRVLLLPGLALLWPLVAWRWAGGARPHPHPRRWHAPAWAVLATLIPALLAVALWPRPAPAPLAERLSPPAERAR